MTDAGGAFLAIESKVKFTGVQFSQNVAAQWQGGAVAMFSGEVSWSKDAETFSRMDVLVDFMVTSEHSGQYFLNVTNICEN